VTGSVDATVCATAQAGTEGKTMRIVAWNCNEGLKRDLPAVRALGADLAVLAEVGPVPPPDSLFDPAPSWHFVDDGVPSHGMALAGLTADLTPFACEGDTGLLSVAGEHPSGLGILGICSRKQDGSTYGAEVARSIEAHRSWLTSKPCVVAGDFNLAPGGIEDRRNGACRAVFDQLAEMGYVSVYHHTTGDAYGEESAATYFHRRHADEGFFIDHCFVHQDLLPSVTGFQIGDYDTWVAAGSAGPGHSDHVPLILDLALPS
jgi:hypothetical protein